jgi:hypothetical protein
LVHRVAGLALTAVSVYHMIYVIGTREGRRNFFLLIPTPKDFLDVFQNSLYFLHLTDKRPKFGRFAYYEKFDYWAVYWGCVIMIGTGFSLWFSDIVTQYVPWLTFKLSALVHADEAILCALALFIWHFYNVHYMPGRFPGTLLFLHGRMSHEEMQHEHPLEYEELMQKEQKDGAGSELCAGLTGCCGDRSDWLAPGPAGARRFAVCGAENGGRRSPGKKKSCIAGKAKENTLNHAGTPGRIQDVSAYAPNLGC